MVGSIILTFALIFSIISMVMYYLNFKGYNNTISYARIFYHLTTIFIIVASALLWYYIMTHQYQYYYIFSYSNNTLPPGLLFASFWGGQQGSFLLWILFTVLIGIFLQSYSSKRGDLEPRLMAVFTLVTSFLILMVSPWLKNPFEYIWATETFIDLKSINSNYLHLPFLQQFLFSDSHSNSNFIQVSKALYAALIQNGIDPNTFIIDGRGLNPQLLNFWMQVHPPVLFVGFAMSTVPYAFAISALMKNDYKDWIRQSFPWLTAAMGVLGLGIMLGGYWAYEMLGWGGYWAWDPVENSSLIPWLIGVAAIHTMIIQKRTQADSQGMGRFVKTNIVLNILIFILVIYSTFLTRSGILGDASVHSFVAPGMTVYLSLLVFIFAFILLGLGMLIYRWKDLQSVTPKDENLFSKELALFTGAVLLVSSAIIVFTGTSAPILGRSVEISFYNEMHLPLAIIFGFLNVISLMLNWKSTNVKDIINKLVIFFSISFGLTVLLIVLGGMTDIMLILLAISSIFTIIVNSHIAIKILKNNMKNLGPYLAHTGLAIFILGVIGSSGYSVEKTLNLVKGKPEQVFGYEIVFTDYTPIETKAETKYAFNIQLKKNGETFKAAPIMYIAEFNNSLMREPYIIGMPAKDIYIAPLSYEVKNDSIAQSSFLIEKGKSIQYENILITFEKFEMDADFIKAMQEGRDFQIAVSLIAVSDNKKIPFKLYRKQSGKNVELTSFESKDLNLRFKLINLSAENINIAISKLDQPESSINNTQEILVISASIKPFIVLVWIGVVVTVLGFFISAIRRIKESY